MLALGIDTSIPKGSVGLCDGHGPPRDLRVDAVYSETLLPAIERILAGAGRRLEEVGLLAAAAGPGSFTGLRIGLATAKGLALALGAPLAGFSTLEMAARAAARAAGSPAGATICVLQEAGRGELYRGLYRIEGEQAGRLLPDAVVPLSAALTGIPDDAIRCAEESAALAPLRASEPSAPWRPRPPIGGLLAAHALALARAHGASALPPPVPNYLRASDAEIHFKG